MASITTTMPNLIDGVSQQPPTLRRKSQCESQVNCLNSVTDGVIKRPPTLLKAKLSSTSLGEVTTHAVNRDSVEKYDIIVQDGDLKVYDLDGNEKTVNFVANKSYLNSTNPSKDFSLLTVKDYTIIVNRSKTISMSSTLSSTRPKEALIHVKAVHKGGTYKVFIDNVVKASITVTDSASVITPSTDTVASQIVAALNDNLTGYTITRYGSIIYLTKTSGDFSIRTEYPSSDMRSFKDRVQSFSDLPPFAVDGFTIEIAGDPEDIDASSWVTTYVGDASMGDGVWEETVGMGINNDFDTTTMPHVLISEADGTFTFQEGDWLSREAGTDESNPEPSFVGYKIQSQFFYKNRLCFLSDENIIMSEDGEFFNFFRTTLQQLLDTDPLDLNAQHEDISELFHGIPFNSSIVLFSDRNQFSLTEDGAVTASKTRINPDTSFLINKNVKPVSSGRNVYFVTINGEWSGLSEYYVESDSQSADAVSVTKHCPRFIPRNIKKLAVNTNEDFLFLLPENSNELHVYQWYYGSGDSGRSEKLQSSHHKWSFGEDATIVDVNFIDDEAIFLIERQDGVYFETMPLDPKDLTTGLGFNVHLDRRVKVQGVYDSDTKTTSWTVPYVSSNDYQVVRDVNFTHGKGQSIVTTRDGSTITALGDYSESEVFIGDSYEKSYEFSEQVYRKDGSDAGVVSTEGRLQLISMEVILANSGYLRAEVTPLNRTTRTKELARIIGDSNNIIGQAYIANTKLTFPILSKADQVQIKLINDSYLPSSILSANWKGQYVEFMKGR